MNMAKSDFGVSRPLHHALISLSRSSVDSPVTNGREPNIMDVPEYNDELVELIAGQWDAQSGHHSIREHMLIHVSLDTRAACLPGESVSARLQEVADSHARLPTTEGFGRAVGQAR